MSGDINTCPEKLFVFSILIGRKGKTLYNGCEEKVDGDTEYIRADIAKEREAKLAKVAFGALKGFYGNLSSVAVIDVYKEAGLEELK